MPYQPPKAVAKPLLTGLGLVITRWAFVEFLLGEFLSFLLDASPPLMYPSRATFRRARYATGYGRFSTFGLKAIRPKKSRRYSPPSTTSARRGTRWFMAFGSEETLRVRPLFKPSAGRFSRQRL
jgi:hypothetical protein